MKMNIERSLDLPLAVPDAWRLLENIEAVATCMPGAKITERVDDTHYKGAVAVKLGPASMTFKGELEVLEMDPATRRIRIAGKASDAVSSAATLELTAVLSEAGEGASKVAGTSEITVNGKAASFGSRLMNSASDQLIGQFYGNLVKQAEAVRAAQVAQPETAVAGEAVGAAQGMGHAAPAAAPEAAPKLNALALLWAVLRDLVMGLFSRHRAM